MGLKNLMGQGPNYVPAYQTSGTPFVTSSIARSRNAGPDRIDFPYVTKNMTIRNTGGEPKLSGQVSSLIKATITSFFLDREVVTTHR